MTMLIPQTEAEWQRFVTDYAESLGWDWMHVGRVGKYTANGAKGTLGEGWPDLLLVKGRRLILESAPCLKLQLRHAASRLSSASVPPSLTLMRWFTSVAF